MDLMLSKEASFIASFGEEEVDWKFSENGDLSTYGSKAVITTLQYLNDSVQNKNFAGAGPLVLAEKYANGITWNGDNSLVEYLDARAVRSYEKLLLNMKRSIPKANGLIMCLTGWMSRRMQISMIKQFVLWN